MLLKSRYKISNEDTTGRYDYDYDENFQLKTVIGFNKQGDTTNLWHYENDTIRYYSNSGGGIRPYVYSDDSIIQYNSDTSQARSIYYLDEQDHVVHMHFSMITPEDFYQEWTGPNITKQTWELWGDTSSYVCTYNEYLNPAYPSNKIIQNDIDGSYNMVERTYDGYGNEIYYYDVVESTDNYPLKIKVYRGNNLEYEFCFEYIIITQTPEFNEEPVNTHSINYYDLMGRKIQKPRKGFYIERKTTDKGTISKKYFIQ